MNKNQKFILLKHNDEKKILVTVCILFSFYYGVYGQSETIFDQYGVQISYSYSSIGTITNSKTGTVFTKYKFVGTIKNSSNKYFDVQSSIKYNHMQVSSEMKNKDDGNFIWTNSMSSDLDHVFCGQSTNNYPNDGVAHLFVIAPGSSSICIKEFVYPQSFGGTPPITYSSSNIKEIKGIPEEQKKEESKTSEPAKWTEWQKSSSCPKIQFRTKTLRMYKLNYQVHIYYQVKSDFDENVNFVFELLNENQRKEFDQGHTLSPGQTQESHHKMSGDYIKYYRVTNAKFANGKPANCDGKGQSTQESNEEFGALLKRYNELCTQLSRSSDPIHISASKSNCNLGEKVENDEKTKYQLKSKITALEKALNANPDAKSGSGLIRELSAEQGVLCEEMRTSGQYGTRAAKSICDKGGFVMPEPGSSAERAKIAELKEDIAALKSAQSASSAKMTKEKEETERKEKEAEAKREQFAQYMAEGRSALGSEQYDNAISKFSTARSYAATPQETAEADRAIAETQKAKKDAARKVRLEEQKKRDTQEDAAYAAGLAGTTGMMLLLKDHYPYKSAYFRMQAGLGGEGIPLIINTPSDNSSETYNNFLPTFYFGFKFGFFNNKPVSWHLNPIFSVGISALSAGTSGGNIDYGGTSYITFSTHSKSKLKLFAEGGYIGRLGSYSYDADAASGGTTTTDLLKDGTYSYSFIRIGGGPMLHFIHDGKETTIKPGIFFDKMSFARPSDKPSMLFNLHVNIESSIIVEFSFSQNYAIPGTASFLSNFTTEDRDYWNFKVIKQGLF